MRRALERSLLEQRSPRRREGAQQPLPREPSDADMRRALQESLEEEQLRRCVQQPKTKKFLWGKPEEHLHRRTLNPGIFLLLRVACPRDFVAGDCCWQIWTR